MLHIHSGAACYTVARQHCTTDLYSRPGTHSSMCQPVYDACILPRYGRGIYNMVYMYNTCLYLRGALYRRPKALHRPLLEARYDRQHIMIDTMYTQTYGSANAAPHMHRAQTRAHPSRRATRRTSRRASRALLHMSSAIVRGSAVAVRNGHRHRTLLAFNGHARCANPEFRNR